MVVKEKSSEVGKSTSGLDNHTSKSNFLAQIDLKVNNAEVEKTTKNVGHRKSVYLDRKKTRKESVTASWRKVVHNVLAKTDDFAILSWIFCMRPSRLDSRVPLAEHWASKG